ncbi:FecR family protein [Mucilaginibacter gynuensis]|uniref:FecR family protein n=1 Tax=Mucilaginibacter gynuensis TaxID=1302236 RepID=A0ABP8GBP3_9SPHI
MTTPNNRLKVLAEKYQAGLCTPEEFKKIREWYDSFETEGYPLPEEPEIKRAAEEATVRAIRHIATTQKTARVKKLWIPVLKIAAILVVIVSAGLLLINNYPRPKLAWQQVSTAAGVKKQVTLPDGSLIQLNSSSVVEFPQQFGKASREIKLKGEAFFTVVHKPEHPFIVHTRHLNIQVLGTSYNIRAYNDDTNTEIAVATGKVGVSGNAQKNNNVFLLTPGQQLIYNSNTKHFEKTILPITDIGSWQQNVLSFNMETLDNISKRLSKVYGVTFVFKSKSLLKKRFQIKVKNESLPNILKLLSISGGDFPYHISGKQVTIG